jgi:hypothetical protein
MLRCAQHDSEGRSREGRSLGPLLSTAHCAAQSDIPALDCHAVILSAAERSEESRSGLFRRETAGRSRCSGTTRREQNDRAGAGGVCSSVFGHVFGFDGHFLNSRNSSFWGPENAKSFSFKRTLGSFRQNSIFFAFSRRFPLACDPVLISSSRALLPRSP